MSRRNNSDGGSSNARNTSTTLTPIGDALVEITVPKGKAHFEVEASPQAKQILKNTLAWKDPDAKYAQSYKNGNWDGYHRLYNERKGTAPIGLLNRARDTLEDRGYTVEVNHAFPTTPLIDVQWNFEHPLREYQIEAIEDTLESRGGIISLPTGAGKTVIALNLVYQLGSQSIIFVHTKQLLHQWAERIESTLGVEPGIIGDGEWTEGPVTVATMQTLVSKGVEKLDQTYGVAIFDECHRTGAAETFQEVGLNIDPVWRIGLSATPWRNADGEELEIEAVTGESCADIPATQLIDQGYLAKPEFEFLHPTGTRSPNRSNGYHETVKKCIVQDPVRNNALTSKAHELATSGERVLITVDRLLHGRLLEFALSPEMDMDEFKDEVINNDLVGEKLLTMLIAIEDLDRLGGQNAVFLSGSASKTERDETLDAFKQGEIDILITTLLKEGTDIPSISSVVLAEGGKSKVQRIQRIGRALRPSNGETAKIVDVADTGAYIGQHFEQRLHDLKEYYGEYGPEKTI